MIKETTVSAKTVDLAVQMGAEELGYGVEKVKYEVIEEGKKGILGIGSSNAVVRVYHEDTPTEIALNFIGTLLENMGVNASVAVKAEDDEGVQIEITGENLGLLIGKHGDMLDSVQYLATLAANKDRDKDDFFRISVDVEGYREKRAEALRALARRMADRVLRSRRNYTLEPMNAYERRIIHSEIQLIEGVTTYSIGQDVDRKIVISLEKK
ncbi:MAG: protein jag [Clostridia bacterium]|nr:protein jag [Clostridia bacterium]MBQ7047474.1 protein jag [Clostridia bacterium]